MASRRLNRSSSTSSDRENMIVDSLQSSPRRSRSKARIRRADDGDCCENYLANCAKLGIPVDPSVYISLQTKWEIMKPSSRFAEGDMQPLIGILTNQTNVRKLNLEGTTMVDSRYRHRGNGNSNARALAEILKDNSLLEDINLRGTGLDDDGLVEICKAIKNNTSITSLNLANNSFGVTGAKALEDALKLNRTLKVIDLTNNQLGFESVQQLECSCSTTGPVLMKAGNFVFEEILNATTHGIAFLLSIVAGCVLLNAVEEQGHVTDYHYWACMIYSFSLVYLFAASTLYHSCFMMAARHRDVLQVLDNIGIYMLIAGTYTPLLLIGLHNSSRGTHLLMFEWVFAGVCSMFTTYADLNLPLNVNIKLFSFIAMGAGCFLIFKDIYSTVGFNVISGYGLGALAYVVGVVFFIKGETVPIYHTVWHLFVVLAAIIHWFCTYHYMVNIVITPDGAMDKMESVAQMLHDTMFDHVK